MKKRGAVLTLSLLCVVLVTGLALAGSSANYAIDWDVVGRGGNEMASASYVLKSTTGQTAIGPSSSTSYSLGAGYWYGIGEVLFRVFLPLTMKQF